MDVIGIAAEQRAMSYCAAEERERDVKNRQTESQQRYGDSRNCGSAVGDGDGQGTQQETDEEAAGIAHKDACGMAIEREEPNDGADESNDKKSDQAVVTNQCSDQDGNRGNQRRA